MFENNKWIKSENLFLNFQKVFRRYQYMDNYKKNYFAPIFTLCLINHKQIRDGITIIVVNTKNVPQSPFNQSTNAPEDDARVVLPAVPMDASNAY